MSSVKKQQLIDSIVENIKQKWDLLLLTQNAPIFNMHVLWVNELYKRKIKSKGYTYNDGY